MRRSIGSAGRGYNSKVREEVQRILEGLGFVQAAKVGVVETRRRQKVASPQQKEAEVGYQVGP